MMKNLMICLLLLGLSFSSQAQDRRKPARILKPIAAPRKLIGVLNAMEEDDDIDEILSFYNKHVPGMVERLEARITPEVIAIAKEDNEDEDDEDEDEDDRPRNRAERARWEDAERVYDAIHMMVEDYFDYEELREEEPEHAEKALKVGVAKYKCLLLGDEIRVLRLRDDKASEAKVSALEGKLRKELDKMFDLKLAAQRDELKWLQKEVEEIKRLIQKKEKYRKQLIEKRLLELTGIAEEMGF